MRRLLFPGIVAASFATACTAIIAGQVGDRADRQVDAGPLTNQDLDDCSLLKGLYGPTPANRCSQCIETNCKPDITYACNGGSYNKKKWFSDMQDCAQSPWAYGFEPQEAGASSSWGCRQYQKTVAAPPDNGSDTEREEQSHNCITNNCMQGGQPDCQLCDVHIKKSANDPVEAQLADDPCGKCVYNNCQDAIIQCCNVSDGLMGLVKRCAYTKEDDNRAACAELRHNELDGGRPDAGAYGSVINSSDQAQVACFHALTDCFKKQCADEPACQP